MRMRFGERPLLRFALAGFALCVACRVVPAAAQGVFAGSWKIVKSEPAPWAKTADLIEKNEVKRLVGARLELRADRIDGPAPLHCVHPRYEVKDYAAEGIFEGGLAEIGDPSTTPDKLADRIGFRKRPIVTIVPNCESEIEYHAIDDDHVIFALNNSLYRLTRVPAKPAKSKP